MPGYQPTANSYLYGMLKRMTLQIQLLATQQNFGIKTSRTGRLLMRGGLQPDATYGLWFLDPTTGNPLVKTNDTGLAVYNDTDVEEVQLGAIGAGVYGLAVRTHTGIMRQVAAASLDSVAGPLTYSANSWGALSGGPSVSVIVPPSGAVDVAIGAIIAPGSDPAGESAYLATALNGGATPYDPYLIVSVGSSSTTRASAYSEWRWGALTPGATATFSTLAWVSTAGLTATFSSVFLKATPV